MKFFVLLTISVLSLSYNFHNVAGAFGSWDMITYKTEYNAAMKCMITNPVTQTDFKKFQDSNYEIASKNIQCFANCYNTAMGIIKNKIFQDAPSLKFLMAANEALPTAEATTIIQNCKTQVSNMNNPDICATSFNYDRCLVLNSKQPLLANYVKL